MIGQIKMEIHFIWFFIYLITTSYADVTKYTWSLHATDHIANDQRISPIAQSFQNVYLRTQCAEKCLRDIKCLSFNFNKDDRICELSRTSHKDTTLQQASGFVYFSRQDISVSQGMMGPCFPNPCENEGLCVVTVVTNGSEASAKCICTQEWTGQHCQQQKAAYEWGLWEEWSVCSRTCGTGWTSRSRACQDPNNDHVPVSSLLCGADYMQLKECVKEPCPKWSDWADWGACSTAHTCGEGVASRSRHCLHGGTAGEDRMCQGPLTETKPCFHTPCQVPVRLTHSAIYGEGVVEHYDTATGTWGAICSQQWDMTDANVLCKQLGFKMAIEARPGEGPSSVKYLLSDVKCTGSETSLLQCAHSEWGKTPVCSSPAYVMCQVDGDWSSWTDWGKCSVDCGNGTEERMRSCSFPPPTNGGKQCQGPDTQTRACVKPLCAVDGGWTEWSEWGSCSVLCGNGTQTSMRSCTNPVPMYGGKTCSGENVKSQVCAMQPCPVAGGWSDWSDWHECSVSCGNGRQVRIRTCDNPVPAYGGATCDGDSEQNQECTMSPCAVNGFFYPWSDWTECIADCANNSGNGFKHRKRVCELPKNEGKDCEGHAYEEKACVIDCPVDGEYQAWSEWSACDGECNVKGSRTRTRECTPPKKGGAPCQGESTEQEDCTAPCPVDGIYQTWSDWSVCRGECVLDDSGTRTRQRQCTPPVNGGNPCEGPSSEEEHCTADCPVDGEYHPWSDWSECSETCGDGIRTRNRVCSGAQHGGNDCVGPDKEEEACNVKPCAVDAVVSSWSDWSKCSVTCGTGTKDRDRVCTPAKHGGVSCEELGPHTESESCFDVEFCPVDGVWTEWTDWSTCSKTCDTGMSFRTRVCEGTMHNGIPCPGDEREEKDCYIEICPVDGQWSAWSDWDACTATCGSATHTRLRTCDGKVGRGADCVGDSSETEDCMLDPCTKPGKWLAWSDWSLCSVTCAGGTRQRARLCNMTTWGEKTHICDPEPITGVTDSEVQDCHQYPCTPVQSTCAKWVELGLLDDVKVEIQLPDFASPINAYCHQDSETGRVYTEIGHNHEQPTNVSGPLYETQGSYQMTLTYDATEEQLAQMMTYSKANGGACRQFLSWDCLSATIWNARRSTLLTTFFSSKKLKIPGSTPMPEPQFYFPTNGDEICGCLEKESCTLADCSCAKKACNCDANTAGVWLRDAGYVTEDLPIWHFAAGDTGGDDEFGVVQVGRYECWEATNAK